MRGRFNAGFIGQLQPTTYGTAKGVYNMAEVQQYSGITQWPKPLDDFYFNYVASLFHGNGGAPLTPSTTGTNSTNFNKDSSTNNFLLETFGDVRGDKFNPFLANFYSNYFDGNTDYLSWSGTTVGTSAYSFECWFYATAAISSWAFLGGPAATTGFLNLRFNSPTVVQVDSNLVSNSQFTVNTILPGTWNHIVVCRDSSNRTTVFLNGVRSSTGATTVTTNYSTATSWLGSSGTQYFTGYIYDARFIVGSTPYDPTQTTITVPTTNLSVIANTVLLTSRSNRFLDLSNNSFSLTQNGDTVVTPFVPNFAQNLISQTSFADNELYKNTDGYYGVSFDGTGDYLDQSVNAAYGFGTNDFTIECWIYSTESGSANGYYIWDFRTSGSATAVRPLLRINSSNVLLYDQGQTSRITGPTLLLRTWYHIAVVKSSGTTTLYLNGVSQGTTSTNDDFGSTARPVIGNVGDVPATFDGCFSGFISNLRVVKGTAVYNTTFTPSTTPLTAITNTSLLTCRSNTVIDSSTNNFTITKNGDADVSLSHPFASATTTGAQLQLRGSTHCDGTGDYLQTNLSSEFTIGTSDFTVDFWVLVLGSTASRRDFIDIIAGSGFNRIIIYYSGSALLYSAGDTVAATTRITGAAIPFGQWTHVALSRVSGSTKLFINGTQTGSTFADTLNWTSTMRAYVGFGQGGSTPHFGYISDVRVLNGTGLYRGNFIPPTAPSTALTNTRLLTSQYYGPSNNSQFKDSSYQNNLVTRSGNVAAGSFSPYPTNNWSVYFDGSGDYLTAPDSVNWDFGTGDFTIELWVKYNSTSGDQAWVTQYQSTTVGWSFRSSATSGATQFFWGDTQIYSVSDAKQVNTWTHYAVSRQGTSLKVFKNGVQLGSTVTDSTNLAGSTATVYIGSVNGSSWYTNGFISDLRIVKGTALYTSNFSVPTGPLTAVANTVLLTCQSNRFEDKSSSNATLTRNGDCRILRFGPYTNSYVYDLGTFGGSAWFDGTGDYLTVSRLTQGSLGSSNWTIECWFYATDTKTSAQIIGNRSTATGTTAYVPIQVTFESSVIKFYSSSNGTAWNINNATTIGNVNLRSWNHVAVVRNGNNLDGYLNGTKVSLSTALSGISYTGTNLFYASGANDPFQGFISDYRLVIGEALYTNNFTPPTAPLTTTANTALMLSMSDAGQYDSAMATNWESVGNTQATPSLSKFGTGCLYFDGTGDYLYSPYYPHHYLGTTFTVEAWVYQTSRGSVAQPFFDQAVAVTTNFAYQGLYITTAGALQFQVRPTTGGAVTTVGGGTVPLTTWTHVAVSVDNSSVSVFVNGSQVGTTTAVTLMAASLPVGVSVGGPGTGYNASAGNAFSGYIDDIRVTRGIARYSGNFSVPLQQYSDR